MRFTKTECMQSWSQAFRAYLEKNGIKQQDASFDLRQPISAINGWARGGRPRSAEVRQHIEDWSRGEVWSHLPRDPIPSRPPPSVVKTIDAEDSRATLESSVPKSTGTAG